MKKKIVYYLHGQFDRMKLKKMGMLILLQTIVSLASAQEGKILDRYNNEKEIKDRISVTLKPGFFIPTGNNVRIFTGTSFVQNVPAAWSPSVNQNYIRTRVFKMPNVNSQNIDSARNTSELNQTVQYIDGLGRSLQSINVQGSPTFRDLVQPIAYDAFGREDKKYLPYSGTLGTSNGSYKSNAIAEQNDFYTNPTDPSGWAAPGVKAIPGNAAFSKTIFEASPLNRTMEQGASGLAWQPVPSGSSGHTLKTEYSTNLLNEVKLWEVNANGATATVYPPGKLYKTITKDENWVEADGKAGTIEEFKDFSSAIVLKKIWETDTKALSAYYVYDDLGNLRYVLPPAVNENGQSVLNSFTEADVAFDQFIYAYHYDGRKRITEKKLPGKGWEHLIYNRLDQVVLTQDANQRVSGQWLFTKYDAFGRVVITGLYTNVAGRISLQSTVEGQSVLWESRTGTDYDGLSFPQVGADWLTVNYYDSYDFAGNIFGIPTGNQVGAGRTKSLLTSTKVRTLGAVKFLLTVNYYDDEGRIVQTRSQNNLDGTDVIDNTWNFAGELIAQVRTHQHPSKGITTISNRFEYDHKGRKLASFQSINGQQELVLNKLEYNELGQLKNKKLHSTDQGLAFLHSTEYAYNERGWLSGTTGDKFNMKLDYNDGPIPQYNGNIAGQSWGTGGAVFTNNFNYGYDRLNRLKSGISTSAGMSEILTYDVMGNIDSLIRDGVKGKYAYNGNRLTQITGALATGVYSYDANGNVIKDGRNGVDLTYNYLSLPVTASKIGLSVGYTYDAKGKKLKKVSGTETTDYLNGIQYKNGTIDFIQTEEGIARLNGSIYSYEYNLSDHLGNIRTTVYRNPGNNSTEAIQRDDYYAFGLRKPVLAASSDNKYLYNGKELQQELGQYDYGARFYDPVIGRWNVVDKKSELYFQITPYAYAANTPTNAIDPDGHIVIFINGNFTDGSGASPRYWRGNLVGTSRFDERVLHPWAFDTGVMNRFKDHNESLKGQVLNPYIDGSLGGNAPQNGNTEVQTRIDAGREKGKHDAAILINSLARTNGVITESLKIVAHSMGAAFAKGYIESIIDYAKAHPALAKGLSITEYDFAAFQQNHLSAIKGVPLYQYDNKGDNVVAGPLGSLYGSRHAKQPGREKESNDDVLSYGGHSIGDFMQIISKLEVGTYRFINGSFVKQ